MIDLEKLLDDWERESKIGDHLDDDSRRSPNLHAKYLRLFSKTKLQLFKAEQDHDILKKDKWLWFNGKLSKEDIDALGWHYDPMNGLKLLKGDMAQFYAADPELQASEAKIAYIKGVLETLREILDNIKWRHQTIKNMMDYLRFEAGN